MRFSLWSSLRNTAFLYSRAKLQVAMPEFSGVRSRDNLNWNFLVALVPFWREVGVWFQDCKAGPSLGSKQKAPTKALSPAWGSPGWQLLPFQLPSKVCGTQDASAHFLSLSEPPCFSVSCPGAWQASFPAAYWRKGGTLAYSCPLWVEKHNNPFFRAAQSEGFILSFLCLNNCYC